MESYQNHQSFQFLRFGSSKSSIMFTEVVDVETVGSDDNHGGGRRVSSVIFSD